MGISDASQVHFSAAKVTSLEYCGIGDYAIAPKSYKEDKSVDVLASLSLKLSLQLSLQLSLKLSPSTACGENAVDLALCADTPIPVWLPHVGVWLLLHSSFVCGGWLLQHLLADTSPCCDRPLVL